VRLKPDDLGDGRHKIQIFAVDAAGQETGSQIGRVRVDRTRPLVRIRRRGRTVRVSVSDGPRSRASLLRRSATKISFGDGTRRNRVSRAGRRYRRGGVYRLRVQARDRAGNKVSLSRRVRVR